MSKNKNFPQDNTQFVLSFELLCLLRWLVENDVDKFKKLINKAMSSGLKEELRYAQKAQVQELYMEEIQQSIVEFFGMLEALIADAISEQAVQTAHEKNLMPTIDQIDSAFCDDETLRGSLEKVTSKIETNSKENPKELLFKEILRRWKPHNKNVLN
jgi:hypothetical protein